MFFNPYEVLGVDSSMSLDDIRKKYRRLAKIYHPDSPTGDAVKFKKVKEAWEIIKSQKEISDKVKPKMGSGINRFRPVTHQTLFKFRRI